VHLLIWIYHVSVVSVLAAVLLALVVNMGLLRLLRPGTVPNLRPLVSVLIPARNEADRIGPCLHSLVNQDYPNIEILVLDDYSEDGTAEVVKQFSQVQLLAGEPLPKGGPGSLGPVISLQTPRLGNSCCLQMRIRSILREQFPRRCTSSSGPEQI
jgi:hypothetical protein